jgi:hypothetical protein
MSALSDPDDSRGFYAIRFRYVASPVPPSEYLLRQGATANREAPARMIEGVDILFWSVAPDLIFKVEPREAPETIDDMRALMKKKNSSPLEFSREWLALGVAPK